MGDVAGTDGSGQDDGPFDNPNEDGDGAGDAGDDGVGDGDAGDDDGAGDDGPPMTGAAYLEISEGPMFAFPKTAPNQVTPQLLELENKGDAKATNLEPQLDGVTFVFQGGYPGPRGTCDEELQSGANCLLDVAFAPFAWGNNEGELTILYDSGDEGAAGITLNGVCGGTSGNLLANPGFSGLNGWSEEPSSWRSQYDLGVQSNVAYAGESGSSEFRLHQDVDISQWADHIDQGQIRVDASVSHRSSSPNNDLHRLHVTFLDGGGQVVGEIAPQLSGNVLWLDFSESMLAPTSARAVRFALECNKSGGSSCDAFFNDVNLLAHFPP